MCSNQVLEMFNHPFILRLYTTFQDANRVFFLTELLTGGELWSIIYESASGFAAGESRFLVASGYPYLMPSTRCQNGNW